MEKRWQTLIISMTDIKIMFSKRFGFEQSEPPIQKDDINEDLTVGLWNCCFNCFFKKRTSANTYFTNTDLVAKKLIQEFIKMPLDEEAFTRASATTLVFRKYYFSLVWYRKLDFIEFLLANYPKRNSEDRTLRRNFIKCCNMTLIRENSAYRIVDGLFVDSVSDVEINAIQTAIVSSPHSLIATHFRSALQLMSNRESPDYRNSIKESISAVELMCKLILHDEKASLGQALERIENRKLIPIHEDLKEAYKRLYKWTCNSEGIRHALKDDSNVDYKEARFMLIICSAFVNYLFEICVQNDFKLYLSETT